MKVREVMTSPAVTVAPDASFRDIADCLLAHHVSGVPVVDADGGLLGIVSESDLISKEAYGPHRARWVWLLFAWLRGRDPRWVRKAGGRRAAEVMTTAPVTASPDDDLDHVARALIETGCNRLPVVEDGRVVGVVARHDLLKPYGRTDAAIARDIAAALVDPMRTPDGHDASAMVTAGIATLRGSARYPSDVAVIAAVIAGIRGVVAVDNHLVAREAEPDARSA